MARPGPECGPDLPRGRIDMQLPPLCRRAGFIARRESTLAVGDTRPGESRVRQQCALELSASVVQRSPHAREEVCAISLSTEAAES
jgi:hypothetical protein